MTEQLVKAHQDELRRAAERRRLLLQVRVDRGRTIRRPAWLNRLRRHPVPAPAPGPAVQAWLADPCGHVIRCR